MKLMRISPVHFCLVLILLVSTTAAASPKVPQNTGSPISAQVEKQSVTFPGGVQAPDVKDIPALLTHAGIPLENLKSVSLRSEPVTPLDEGDYQWHTFYGSSVIDEDYSVAVNKKGEVYITGYSDDSWNGPTGQAPLHSHSGIGTTDFFILKLDAAGAYQWHTFYGLVHSQLGYGITLDNNSGVYIVGECQASWNGPAGDEPLHPFTGVADIFVLKLDSNGTYQWHTFYGSSSDDKGWGIALDDSGGIYIAGQSNATWNGPTGQAPLHAYSGGNYDFMVLKLNSAGEYQWHTFYGSILEEDGFSITLDSSGIYIAGASYASWNGPSGEVPLHAYSGGTGFDIAVLKLNAAGEYQWHTFYGAVNFDDVGYGIAADRRGGEYIVGSSGATWNGPCCQGPIHAFSGGYSDIFVLKLDSTGAYQWHTFYGGAFGDLGSYIATDDSGGVFISGGSASSWNGPLGQTPRHAYSGEGDITILKLDSAGDYQWHTFLGSSTSSENGRGIVVKGGLGVYIAASSHAAWNGPSGQAPLHEYNGNSDITLLKLSSYVSYNLYLPVLLK